MLYHNWDHLQRLLYLSTYFQNHLLVLDMVPIFDFHIKFQDFKPIRKNKALIVGKWKLLLGYDGLSSLCKPIYHLKISFSLQFSAVELRPFL